MDQFELTKIAGAVLPALLLIFGVKTIVESRQSGPPAKPGYTLPMPSADAAATAEAAPAEGAAAEGAASADGAAPAAAASGPEAVLAALPKASADSGKTLFNKCKACHSVEKGKPKGVGPNLHGVVNRAKASSEGFEYSAALKEKGGEWTFADLAGFISNPKAYVPGTKMVFNGLPPGDTADIIAYLAAQSDTPVELPK